MSHRFDTVVDDPERVPTPRRIAGANRSRERMRQRRLCMVGIERLLKHHGLTELADLLWREHSFLHGLARTTDPNELRKWSASLADVRRKVRDIILTRHLSEEP